MAYNIFFNLGIKERGLKYICCYIKKLIAKICTNTVKSRSQKVITVYKHQKFPFINNMRKPACAFKQDGLVLTTLQYIFQNLDVYLLDPGSNSIRDSTGNSLTPFPENPQESPTIFSLPISGKWNSSTTDGCNLKTKTKTRRDIYMNVTTKTLMGFIYTFWYSLSSTSSILE